jgi:small subunit ribosomal protein S23
MHEGQRQKEEAYDIARKEFYALRHEEEVERRVAMEEAMWTGAYFGKGALEVGMELEDKTYNEWLDWAVKNVETLERDREAAYTSIPGADDMETDVDGVMDTEQPTAAPSPIAA